MARLVSRCASGGQAAASRARSVAVRSTSPVGVTRSASPQSSAVPASSRKSVKSARLARAGPTRLARRGSPPQASGSPRRTSGRRRNASAPSTRQSQASASTAPPPTAAPSMAAMVT
ncbi:hypothetical protein G6F40_017579 [Rhizopus arrhizus]|nr:hypothetical protein G6F40_017579 [Rhizopus arrhizus]